MPIFSHNFSGLFFQKEKPEKKPDPIVLSDSLGTFTLDRDVYCGEVELMGRNVSVLLEPDGKGKRSASSALHHLHAFAAKAAEWDAEIKQFAADDFAGKDRRIATWGGCESDSEGKLVSKEEFMRRMKLNFIQFYRDGSLFLDYDLDDMFTDHGLGVNADISGGIVSCALWG